MSVEVTTAELFTKIGKLIMQVDVQAEELEQYKQALTILNARVQELTPAPESVEEEKPKRTRKAK